MGGEHPEGDSSAPRWDRAGRPKPLLCLMGRHQWGPHYALDGEEYIACVRCQKHRDD